MSVVEGEIKGPTVLISLAFPPKLVKRFGQLVIDVQGLWRAPGAECAGTSIRG